MTASSPDQLAPGAILAERYEIIRRLGAGGMGAVYLARHRLMDRLCALKVLPPGHHRDAEALERFTREARNASRIVHPNVCTVYDFGTTVEGVAYLAMEYLEGRTLGAILAEHGRLPLDRTVRLTREIAAGLDGAHELGIVHRDLKPDNVMVLASRAGETVKLVDFGIAKALEAEPSREMTAPGVVIGTPDYMSPEQFAGDPVDPRTDVYALGVMFYRMVTGSLPHLGESARETLTKRLTEPPRSLGDVAPDLVVPAGLHSIVEKVLARRPAERYPTAGAFSDAVVSLLTGPLDISSLPTVRLDAATSPMPIATTRPRRNVAFSAAGLLGLAVVAALLLLQQGGDAGLTPATNDLVVNPPSALGPPPPAPQPSAAPTESTRSQQATLPPATSQRVRESTLARPVTPPPAPATPPPAPVAPPTERDLPDLNEIFNPATRDAARRKAEQIYAHEGASFAVRAQAALVVATVHNEAQQYELARRWATSAQAMNSQDEPGDRRDSRAERIRRLLATLPQSPDTTGS
ncbi:MAG TPA: serine/threonine-protein kinase [Gemmatimonadales bacterium]